MRRDKKPSQKILKGSPKTQMNESHVRTATVIHKRHVKKVNATQGDSVPLLEALLDTSRQK